MVLLRLEIKLHTQYELAGGGIVATAAVGSRSQAVDLEIRRIHAAVLCDGEHVAYGSVDAERIHEPDFGQRQGVAERKLVKFEIVAAFQEVVADNRVLCRRYLLVLSVCFAERVAGEITGAVIEIVDVEDVESECTTEEQRQVEILVAEVVAHGEGEFGQTVAYILAVGLCALDAFDDVAVLVVDQPFAVGGDAGIFEHVEFTYRAAFLDALDGDVGIRVLCVGHVVVVVADELGVAEVHEFVRLCCADEIHGVGEIACLHGIECDVELEALVSHRSHVNIGVCEQIGGIGTR